MQQWYNEHIISPTRRQLIIIICSTDEKKQTATTGIISDTPISSSTHDTPRNRYSFRSSFSVTNERYPRLIRRQDFSRDHTDDSTSLLKSKSKSESKLRCLTTKHKHFLDLRSTKSETIQIKNLFIYPDNQSKLDYIIKSFESIEINNDYNKNQYRNSLKIFLQSNEFNQTFISIKNLKEFKESCLLYNVTSIK